MSLRHWSRKRIRRLWLLAAVLQLAILGAWAILYYDYLHESPLMAVSTDATHLSRLDSARRTAILAMLRDSLGVELTVSGDTIREVRLTPEGRRRAARGGVIARAFDQMGPMLLVGTLVAYLMIFSPTIVAAIITALWWTQRPHEGRSV